MKTVLNISSFLMIAGLSGCETMKGFGRDIPKAGETVEKKLTSNAQA